MKLILSLPLPLNQVYRVQGNRVYKTRPAKDWQEEAGMIALCAKNKAGMQMFSGDVTMRVLIAQDRRRDIDSGLKLLLDALEGVIYKNDRQIKELSVNIVHEKPYGMWIDVNQKS